LSRGAARTAVLVVLAALAVLAAVLVPTVFGPATATPAAAPVPAAVPAPIPVPTPTAAPAAGGPELRVMTWNVRTNAFDAPDWAPVVAERRPDVVAFQEICAGDAQDLADLLRAEHGLDYQVVPGPAREALYETCETTAAGPVVFGQAVLSRVPLRDPVTTPLPDGGGIDEPRAFLAVTLDLPGTPVRLLTTHITVGPGADDSAALAEQRVALQAAQIDAVTRAAADSGERVVVLGDLNVGPDDPKLDGLERAGLLEVDRERNAPTGNNRFDAPGSPAENKIDYVFVRGLTQVGEPETYWVPSSDHRPLVAVLRPEEG
jgi:endonuclease/exonuclease/phosphatase family metal-dependent hydrolase